MGFTLQLRVMLATLRAHAVRSALAVCTVGIAIASMMIVMALGVGAEREFRAVNAQLGRDLFAVTPAQVLAPPGRGVGWFTAPTLRRRDVRAMRSLIPQIASVAPVLEDRLKVRIGRTDVVTNVRGVTSEFFSLRDLHLAEGRSLGEADDRARRRVAVAGATVAMQLYDGESMVGASVLIGGVPFEVVGQLRPRGLSSDGWDEDDQVLIPLDTAARRLLNVDSLSRLLVQARDDAAMGPAQRMTRELLRVTHHLDDDTKDDFEVLDTIRTRQIQKLSVQYMGGLGRIVAAIMLLIGGGGVFAVAYLNVNDRIAEVGLRMAIGARRRDIRNLFVAESCVLSALGGISGLLVGWAGVVVLSSLTTWQAAIDLNTVVVPFVISVGIGLVCGVGPAIKASGAAPVAALSHG